MGAVTVHNHPHKLIARTQDDAGFTLIHGDAGRSILVPARRGAPFISSTASAAGA
ncbi:MAG: hypothetical protein IPJ94_19690 [Chloroflexi bacterium]|nr:hypothetical protein [Chloroflexota bacterium]